MAQSLKIIGFAGARIDPKTKDRVLVFNYSDGQPRQIVLDPGMLGSLFAALWALKDRLQPNATGETFQPLELTGAAGPLRHPRGQVLTLELEGAVHLPVLLSESMSADLRILLDRFGSPKTSPPTPTH
jgi:hypothetical protein